MLPRWNPGSPARFAMTEEQARELCKGWGRKHALDAIQVLLHQCQDDSPEEDLTIEQAVERAISYYQADWAAVNASVASGLDMEAAFDAYDEGFGSMLNEAVRIASGKDSQSGKESEGA